MKRKNRKRFVKESALRLRGTLKTGVTLSIIAIVGVALIFTHCRQQYNLTGPYARDYEGKILDKSQTITESQTGSGVRRRLLIEGTGGERFQVAIGENTYERVQKGMWIKKTEAGVELTWPEPTMSAR